MGLVTEAMEKINKLKNIEKEAEQAAAEATAETPLNPKIPNLEKLMRIDLQSEVIPSAKKLASRSELKAADDRAHEVLVSKVKDRAILDMEHTIIRRNEERRKDQIRKEFEIISNYGARETRYEFVKDVEKEEMVYINIDTMQVLNAKTAICEKCDFVYELPSEIRCRGCNAPRSTKNFKLYKPLGS